MTKFLVLYRSDTTAQEQMAGSTPEQRAAAMQAWMDWAAAAGDALVDLGSPLGAASPQADPKINGFSIVQADSAEAAMKVMDGHPHAVMGGTIDVHEMKTPPGM